MRACTYADYGPPEVLRAAELDTPVPTDGELLVRVLATTVTATDCTFRRGEPWFTRLFTGLRRPKNAVLGSEFTGVIEAVGPGVTRFSVGDRVVGTTPGAGSWAEYVCLAEAGSTVAAVPDGVSHVDALACCDGFLTALPFLRDGGRLTAGQDVLVNGASGSVGSAAVQLARHLGARVTGVCSAANADLVRSLGAHEVIDYTERAFWSEGREYDIIFDTVGGTTFSRCRRALKADGRYLQASVGLGVLPAVVRSRFWGGRKAVVMATGLRSGETRSRDLAHIQNLAQTGAVVPVIDRRYAFDDLPAANAYVDTGRKRGNVIISLDADA